MLAAVLSVALALAEPTEAAREQARVAFGDGTKRFADGDYDAALGAFREAYRLAPHDKVRFNIGQCLVRLGRNREAVGELEAVADGTQLSDSDRALARAKADEAAAQLGTFSFTGPAGKTVVVDEDLRCTLPCSMRVDAGMHRIGLEGESGTLHRVERRETVEIPLAAARVEPPAPIPPTPIEPARDRPPPPASRERPRPSALTWVGLPLTVLGGAGIIGFGLRANQLHDDYVAGPDLSTRDKGVTMRNLANASIAVALLGAALITADVIRIAVKRRR